MTRLGLFLLLLTLPACVNPRLDAGIVLDGNGVSVRPSISTRIEGAGTITYTP